MATLAPVALPIVSAPPPKFQRLASWMLTTLLDEPLPMVRPTLYMVALVTVIESLPPPVVPMEIIPLLEKVTALVAPITFKLLLLALRPPPTVIAPPPK